MNAIPDIVVKQSFNLSHVKHSTHVYFEKDVENWLVVPYVYVLILNINK